MSLFGILNLGSSALAVQQTALQVTSNNISNAGDANYAREVAETAPGADIQSGTGFAVGTGVDITAIQRQVDEALNSRLRSSTSDSEAATTSEQWLSQVQSVFNALSSQDLSSQMSTFFNDFSTVASSPQDLSDRQVAIQDGQTLAQSFQSTYGQLQGLQGDADQQLQSMTQNANNLAQQIASLNGQIVAAGGGTAGSNGATNSLSDQLDGDLSQLSQMMNIQTIQGSDGTMNVYVGSQPLVIGTQNRSMAFSQQTVDGQTAGSIVFQDNDGTVPVTGGQLGALCDVVNSQIPQVMGQVNTLASNVIFEVNKLHSSGQGLTGYSSVSSTNAVADATAPLNSTQADLPFAPSSGSFVVSVTNTATGLASSTLVNVNLASDGSSGMSLNDLASSLGAIDGVSAQVVGGQLQITAASGDQIGFSQDSSNVLACLGINSFFTGSNAANMAVNNTLVNDPSLLAAAQNGDATDNSNALAIAGLATQNLSDLGGASLNDGYENMINSVAVATNTAQTNAQAATTIQQTLTNQQQAVSGVSLDEETVNMLQEQQAYQGAARVISTVDQMMQSLLAMPL